MVVTRGWRRESEELLSSEHRVSAGDEEKALEVPTDYGRSHSVPLRCAFNSDSVVDFITRAFYYNVF